MEVGGWRLEFGGWKLEIGDWRLVPEIIKNGVGHGLLFFVRLERCKIEPWGMAGGWLRLDFHEKACFSRFSELAKTRLLMEI